MGVYRHNSIHDEPEKVHLSQEETHILHASAMGGPTGGSTGLVLLRLLNSPASRLFPSLSEEGLLLVLLLLVPEFGPLSEVMGVVTAELLPLVTDGWPASLAVVLSLVVVLSSVMMGGVSSVNLSGPGSESSPAKVHPPEE